ncbi:Glutaredoxin-1 [Cedecea neteri]|uniref:Glutaredoxin-1 n=1 Tax=Cedecea neteri TaxID=158822 RepID=A0A2X2ST98_9ENTR|nr:Glutaredoxin-1 [Cedecea neteri]
MFAVIFGRPGCPYCVRAKELAEKLTAERDDFNFRYVDIHRRRHYQSRPGKNRG